MRDIKDKLIVALDVPTLEKAKEIVGKLYPAVKLFKVGSQLFTTCGPAAVEMIGQKGARVFLDLKFHDIPNTVYLASTSGTTCAYVHIGNEKKDVASLAIPPVFMMTVHIAGGRKMLEEAARSAKETSDELGITKPFIVGVTRLTSEEYNENTQKEVLDSARLAQGAGLDGVVCAASEAKMIREEFGENFVIVTPGIRPKGAAAGDQKRVATAKDAIAAGANYIVVGRPILEAADPLKAAKDIIKEM